VARLFLAAWPDSRSAAALTALAGRLAAEAGGKAMPEAKIHLTLAFLGAIDDAKRAAAIDAARTIAGTAFELAVDQAGSFRRARVAWAGISRPPPALLLLQSRLEAALRGRGIELDDRPFAPHMTLVRNTVRAIPVAPIAPIAWRVDAFTLVRSETGTGTYIVEERWALGD
jgi:2'-5' RNA ligase